MLNDIQITSDYMSRWVVLKRRVGSVTSQRVLKVLFYVNILQCFFVVENFTTNAVSVAIAKVLFLHAYMTVAMLAILFRPFALWLPNTLIIFGFPIVRF